MKTTSKQADATMAKLTSAMARNTTLATGQGSAEGSGPVATYTAPPAPSAPPQTAHRRRSASGIRFTPDDMARIREIIQAGLALQHTLAASDAIRLALRAFDPRRLTAADIAQLRARDGRSMAAALRK